MSRTPSDTPDYDDGSTPRTQKRSTTPRTPTGRVTIRDVARLAAVSPTTVSRVINQQVRVDAATAARVREAIDTLAWVPNPGASSLGRTRQLVVAPVTINGTTHTIMGAAAAIAAVLEALGQG